MSSALSGMGDPRLKRHPEDHNLSRVRVQACCQCGSESSGSAVLPGALLLWVGAPECTAQQY